MAVAVDGSDCRLRAALSVDGGVGSAGRVYAGDAAGSAGRYNAAVSHRLDSGIGTMRAGVMTAEDGSDCLLRLSEDGVSAGYVLARGCNDRLGEITTIRAGDSHGHFASYEAVLGVGDRGTNDLLEAGGSTWDLPGSEEGIGTVRVRIAAGRADPGRDGGGDGHDSQDGGGGDGGLFP